jgi:hypothetical protein
VTEQLVGAHADCHQPFRGVAHVRHCTPR